MAVEGDIQTVLGALVANRCYPLIAPQETASPYIIYQVISTVPETSLDGPTGTNRRRVQVDVYADTYGAAKVLEQSIGAAMQAADFTNLPLSATDLFESEVQLYRVTMDFAIWTMI